MGIRNAASAARLAAAKSFLRSSGYLRNFLTTAMPRCLLSLLLASFTASAPLLPPQVGSDNCDPDRFWWSPLAVM